MDRLPPDPILAASSLSAMKRESFCSALRSTTISGKLCMVKPIGGPLLAVTFLDREKGATTKQDLACENSLEISIQTARLLIRGCPRFEPWCAHQANQRNRVQNRQNERPNACRSSTHWLGVVNILASIPVERAPSRLALTSSKKTVSSASRLYFSIAWRNMAGSGFNMPISADVTAPSNARQN